MPIPAEDPILVAPSPTPFDDKDAVDYSAIQHNVARWLKTPLSGFVLNSENGEEAFLSEEERLAIVRTIHAVCGPEKFIVGGIDNPSVRETLRLGEALADAGAELLRLRIPRLTDNVQDYFQQVIPRAAVPVVIIHQMAPGKFLSNAASIGAPAELIGQLVAMDNVFGYICSDNLRFEARVRTLIPTDKRFWISNGSLLLTGAALGANGGCMMLGNVLPGECLAILRLVSEGKLAQAQAIQTRILEPDWQILTRGAAGIKAALDVLGYRGGSPRAPASACDAAGAAKIREALERVCASGK